jgi:hypothetical protein
MSMATAGVTTSAWAAPYPVSGLSVTGVAISPTSDSASQGVCNPYAITLQTAAQGQSVTAQISQTTSDVQAALKIGFCSPAGGQDSSTVGAQPSPDTSGPRNGTTTTAGPGSPACSSPKPAAGATSNTASCEAVFVDSNSDKTIVIGVTSDHAGSMEVHAFADKNGNGAADTAEPEATASKTWIAVDPKAGNNKISCTPDSATNPAGTAHDFTCTVTDPPGNVVPGAEVHFVVASGPDSTKTGSCGTTGDGSAGSTDPGTADCSYTNNGQTGHDVITAWVETNGTAGSQNGEPTTTITKDWAQPAPSGSTLTLSCSPNQTTVGGSDPTCQEPTTRGQVTITATVQSGTPPAAVNNAIVTFDQPVDTSPAGKSDSGDQETVGPTQCTTDNTGKCSVTFTDSSPSDGESFTVKGTLARQGQGAATATATIVYHNPTKEDARNISVSPGSTAKASGDVQQFTATVKDRFGNLVPGVLVGWTESGPGTFRSGNNTATCTSNSVGQCSVEVTSLATEKGTQTVTATIDTSNYPAAGPTGNHNECAAPAGKTYVTPSNSTTPGDAPGAPAGNCSAKGTVNWTQTQPPPQRQHPVLTCFSPRKHVLKCKVVSSPRVVGAEVKFRRVHADGTLGKLIALRTTNSNGVAKFRKRHLKSGKVWRVIAHVARQGDVRGGYSNIDKTRIT